MTNCSPIISFNVAIFRAQFTAFANEGCFPTDMLQMYWDQATAFVSNKDYGWLQGADRRLAINYMTAHLIALLQIINAGEMPGIVTGATIDKVNVTLMEPPVKDGWQYWLNQTPYGVALLALLTVKSTGGFYVPGSLGRAGFNFAGPALGWPYGQS